MLLTGCGSNPVQKDLLSYINDYIVPMAPEETKIMDQFESVTGANYTDDETLYNMLMDTIIPAYRDYSDKLQTIQPETPEVRELHEQYIALSVVTQSTFIGFADALEKQDLGLANEANTKLQQANKLGREFQTQLKDMAKKYKVEFKTK
ncbi:hypothetical protein E0485_09100 [Paenibacillus albiflavus]|uniref:Uncharacterized protein n=2 Tax=Paenibacillus albiflavus TaxID=2545760 RepID=A0A4R4EE31_9BACL|nr:hypothetical protein E0485_09100 [Paenibacillus albiflavus]